MDERTREKTRRPIHEGPREREDRDRGYGALVEEGPAPPPGPPPPSHRYNISFRKITGSKRLPMYKTNIVNRDLYLRSSDCLTQGSLPRSRTPGRGPGIICSFYAHPILDAPTSSSSVRPRGSRRFLSLSLSPLLHAESLSYRLCTYTDAVPRVCACAVPAE